MIVFASDIHLTDGTSGATIDAGAFAKFASYLEQMAEAAGAREVEVVLLGDIFDVIRSDLWLATSIRPWSKEAERDGEGRGVAHYTGAIVDRILLHNRAALDHLGALRRAFEKKGIHFGISYIVGNHDWLLNRYPTTRQSVARALGMGSPAGSSAERFPVSAFFERYGVFARHGDIYDAFNYDGDRDGSSLGDAIVIDLINRFPRAVAAEIGESADPALVAALKEIDNVRPILDIPVWVESVCRRTAPATAERVKAVWNRLVDDFLAIDFVRAHDIPWRPDPVDYLGSALRMTKHLTFRQIARLPLRQLETTEDDYTDHALAEERLAADEASFVVFGHTHHHLIQPLARARAADSGERVKTYFNSGTWRKVHLRAAVPKDRPEFAAWYVMTFLAFYLDDERGERSFEVWNGALG